MIRFEWKGPDQMKKTIITTVCAASLIGAIAFTASAQLRGPGMRMPALEEVDTNSDGNISKTELEAHKANRFAAADTSGDGLVSFEEFEAHALAEKAKREAQRRERRFARLDANGDGYVSAEEHAAADDERMARRFERVDTNGDGMISAEEREAAKAKRKERRMKRWGDK
jgi:Ca2+-binding EF-hand superfamily protein